MSAAPAPAGELSQAAQLAIALQRNRELAIRVYALRNECPVSATLAQFSAILRNFSETPPSSSPGTRARPTISA